MMLVSTENVLAGQLRHVWLSRHSCRKHQVGGSQGKAFAVAVDLDRPPLCLGIEHRRQTRVEIQYGISITRV